MGERGERWGGGKMINSIEGEYGETSISSAEGSPRPEVMKKFHAQLSWSWILAFQHLWAGKIALSAYLSLKNSDFLGIFILMRN